MALRPCRECGQDVSTKAKTCPNCGVKKPGRKEYSAKWLLVGAVVAIGFVAALSTDDRPAPTTPERNPAPARPQAPPIPAADRTAINTWLTEWSTAQAASVRETCLADPDCDADQYLPSARPETSFGWDGASRIEPTEDWAEGPRYHVTANGRTALVYLRSGQVVGVDLIGEGGRRNICREEECRP